MRRYKAILVLAIVLALLAAAVVPISAGKPGPPGGEKSKGGEPPGQSKPKKNEGKGQPPGLRAPEPKPEPDEAAGEMVTICHKPGTPAQQTLRVALPALQAHLNHGDEEGACDSELPPPIPVPTDTLTITVTICHKPGTPAEKTLELPQAALKGHLGHGDQLGACPDSPPSPIPVPPGTQTVTLCHKPGTPAEHTLDVPVEDVAGHLNHGDALGPCEDGQPPPIPLPPGTLTVTVCHKPGTPAEQTLDVPVDELDGHLKHGDTLGPCDGTPSDLGRIGLAGAPGMWPMPAFVWKGGRHLVIY